MMEMYNLAQLSLFANLNEEQLNYLLSKTKLQNCTRGTILFREGQETNGTYIILSGLVKIFVLHKEGKEKTLAILKEGDILGEMTLFNNPFRSATAEALDDSAYLHISNRDFIQLLADIPPLALNIIELLTARLRHADQQIQELMFLNARSRIICNLVHLAAVHGVAEHDRIRIPLRLTHAELANLVGVSRETVTKVLDELQKNHLIYIKNKQLWLLDTEELYRQGTMD